MTTPTDAEITGEYDRAYNATRSWDRHVIALRAVLAKWGQPQAGDPVAWRTFDGEGGYDYRTYEANENYRAEWEKRNPNHIGWVEPLYAAPQPAVAAGWVMVPIEPTEEMLANVDQEVGGHCHSCTKWRASYTDCKAIWSDMLAALPPAPSTEGESNANS